MYSLLKFRIGVMKLGLINNDKKNKKKFVLSNTDLFKNTSLYLMLMPAVVLLIIFNYIPMYGIISAFQNYYPNKGYFGSEFVGLKWFKYLFFDSPDFLRILYNTISISLLKIAVGTTASVAFAIFLYEVGNSFFKRIFQTIVYFPYFLSWVIVGNIFIDFLSPSGLINSFLIKLGVDPIFFLGDNHWFKFSIILTNTWQTFGFGAVIYIAAMTGINPEQYEAAAIDGASRLKKILYITIPGIMPTIIMMITLNLGYVLNAGQDQILVMYNAAVYQSGDILDTFVYRTGLLNAQYSLAAAVGLFKGLVGLIFIIAANKASIRFAHRRIF